MNCDEKEKLEFVTESLYQIYALCEMGRIYSEHREPNKVLEVSEEVYTVIRDHAKKAVDVMLEVENL
jgi:hypothetical protein